MNKAKILGIIKSKVGVGIICFILGSSIFGNTTTLQKKLDDSNNQVKTLQSQLDDTTSKLKTSEDKVAQAQPYFDMKNEEQKQIQAKADKDKADRLAQEKAQADAEAKAKLEAKTKTLSNGNYIAGQDFDAGTYTITVVSGNGNVSSDNMYSGGINAIMGTKNEDMYQKEFKNIKLPKGTTLIISDVTIKLTPTS
jgi:hypothetical protein